MDKSIFGLRPATARYMSLGFSSLLSLFFQGCSSEGSSPAAQAGTSAAGSPATNSGGTPATTGGAGGAAGSSGGTAAGGTSAGGTSAGSTGTAGAAGSGAAGGNGTDVSNFWGSIAVSMYPANPALSTPAYTGVLGIVYDKVNPSNTIALKVKREESGCKLLVPEAPFCSACTSAMGVCTAEEVCTPFAKRQNLGNVTVTGLKPMDFVMEPFPPSFDYQSSAALPNPPCDEGAAFGVETGAFRIQGSCIAQLVLDGMTSIPVRSGQPVAVRWQPPGKPDLSRISIYLDIAHHGGKKGEINCDVPDTGSFDIPEPLVTELVSLGLAGFPTIIVTRYSEAKADKAPNVKLVMSSQIERAVDTGVVSCSSDANCEGGETCQADKTCG